MPQVAARINEQQERWLKDYFRTKSAGAEFILPWAVDTFFRAITTIKGTFTGPELKTILEAHRDQRLIPASPIFSCALPICASKPTSIPVTARAAPALKPS
mgnify:CR=1 FL=1